jgi:hypothetical protein
VAEDGAVDEAVGDGDGAGPFASAAAIAAFNVDRSTEPSFLPLTKTVGVEDTPRLLASSVSACTSVLCCSLCTHVANVVFCLLGRPSVFA